MRDGELWLKMRLRIATLLGRAMRLRCVLDVFVVDLRELILHKTNYSFSTLRFLSLARLLRENNIVDFVEQFLREVLAKVQCEEHRH